VKGKEDFLAGSLISEREILIQGERLKSTWFLVYNHALSQTLKRLAEKGRCLQHQKRGKCIHPCRVSGTLNLLKKRKEIP
jgi:hypothetical protein